MNERHAYTDAYFAERERSPTFALEVHAIKRVLARHGVLTGCVLEVGAGSGALARSCASHSRMWIAADRDLRFFGRHERDDSASHPVICDARHPPLSARSCDAVVAQHVIEHFQEPVRVLSEWAATLRKGGICVLVTPNRLFPRLHWFDDPTHYVLFSAEELAALMGSAGFMRISVKRLVPWLGSDRVVYMAARVQRWMPGALDLARDPSLSLLAVGSV